jgi:hypothetical protein
MLFYQHKSNIKSAIKEIEIHSTRRPTHLTLKQLKVSGLDPVQPRPHRREPRR